VEFVQQFVQCEWLLDESTDTRVEKLFHLIIGTIAAAYQDLG
jgi:hypothetical protein